MGNATKAVGIATLEAVDGLAGLRNALRKVAADRGLWAGLPMPIDDQPLVIEPRWPMADKINAMQAQLRPPTEPDGKHKLRGVFWSSHRRCDIVLGEDERGRVFHVKVPRSHGLDHQLLTLGASDVWGIEQEAAAVQTLARHLRHRQFKQYLLTGSFMERSLRSGVHYLFRRLRPTIAITANGGPCHLDRHRGDRDKLRILAALCLHPIAYYSESWAGAMCPTDDVLAHLMLMRGDEPMFWRRANQHAAYRPEAGL